MDDFRFYERICDNFFWDWSLISSIQRLFVFANAVSSDLLTLTSKKKKRKLLSKPVFLEDWDDDQIENFTITVAFNVLERMRRLVRLQNNA